MFPFRILVDSVGPCFCEVKEILQNQLESLIIIGMQEFESKKGTLAFQ